MAEVSRIVVGADKPYPVVIGRSLLEQVPEHLKAVSYTHLTLPTNREV